MPARIFIFLMMHSVLAFFAIRRVLASDGSPSLKAFWTIFAAAIPGFGPIICLGLADMPRRHLPELSAARANKGLGFSDEEDAYEKELAAAHRAENLPLREKLLADLQETPLGNYLVDFLESRYIALVVTDDFPKREGNALGNSSIGVFRMQAKPIVLIDGRLPYPEILHVFAHETRHAAQHAAEFREADDQGRTYSPLWGSPRRTMLHTRMTEMDAEAFAVYFVAQFSKLRGQDFVQQITGRGHGSMARLYQVYMDALAGFPDRPDMAVMIAAKQSFGPDSRKWYDRYTLEAFDDDWLPVMERTLDSPARDGTRQFYRRIADAAQREPDANREFVLHYAKLYSGIFADQGFPGYTAHWADDDLCDFILKDTDTPTAARVDEAQRRFLDLCRRHRSAQNLLTS